MSTDRPDDLPPERDPPERPRRRRDGDDYDDRPPQKSNSTNVILILLGIGAFVVVSGGCLVIVSIAAITALGSNANSTFSMVGGNVKPSSGGSAKASSYVPLKSDVDRFQFHNDVFRKSTIEVASLLGAPAMKNTDPNNPRTEFWYYTGTNPQTGLPTKLPNTANGALVRLRFFDGNVFLVEWEPKQ